MPPASSTSSSSSRNRYHLMTRQTLANQYLKEFLAEFIGTFMLMAVGDGGVASYTLSSLISSDGKPEKDTFAVCLSFGVGALIGITISLPISGAHINPAVTIAQASIGKFPWKKTIHYLAAQFLGGFVAAAVVYLTYYQAIEAFDKGHRLAYQVVAKSTTNSDNLTDLCNSTVLIQLLNKQSSDSTATGKIFATYPAPYLTIWGCLIDQIVGTALLLIGVTAVTDENGLNAPQYLLPTILALIITTLCVAYGLNCAAIFNPARDFSPRLFTALAGYGLKSFEPLDWQYWWVAGIVGPILGGILGVYIYHYSIEIHRVNDSSERERRDTNATDKQDDDDKDIQPTGSIDTRTQQERRIELEYIPLKEQI